MCARQCLTALAFVPAAIPLPAPGRVFVRFAPSDRWPQKNAHSRPRRRVSQATGAFHATGPRWHQLCRRFRGWFRLERERALRERWGRVAVAPAAKRLRAPSLARSLAHRSLNPGRISAARLASSKEGILAQACLSGRGRCSSPPLSRTNSNLLQLPTHPRAGDTRQAEEAGSANYPINNELP